MSETSTFRRGSNISRNEGLRFLSEESGTFSNIDLPDWNAANSYIPIDSFGNEAVVYPSSPHNRFWYSGGTDEPLSPRLTALDLAYVGALSAYWHRPLSAHSLLTLGTDERPNPHPFWHHDYGPVPQGGITPMTIGLHTNEATDMGAVVLADIEGTTVRQLTALLQGLVKPQGQAADNRARELLEAKLLASFENSPLEDGMDHPAEGILAEALQSRKDHGVLGWLKDICTDASRPSFAASVLRCLGRQEGVGAASWRVDLVRAGLAIGNVEIRDAAVQAAESWGDTASLDVLTAHSEPEPWLRQYIRDVVEDLTK